MAGRENCISRLQSQPVHPQIRQAPSKLHLLQTKAQGHSAETLKAERAVARRFPHACLPMT